MDDKTLLVELKKENKELNEALDELDGKCENCKKKLIVIEVLLENCFL